MSDPIYLDTAQHLPNDKNLANYTDETLVSLLGNTESDDHSILTSLISRHYAWVVRRCLFRLGNPHDAEEAAQEIALKCVRSLHQFQHRSKFKTWLYRIIDNYCNTYAIRRSKFNISEKVKDQLFEHQPQEVPDPQVVMSNVDMVRQIFSLMPESARQVLSLRFYAGYSLEEISCMLQLTLSACKARLYRSINLFKQLHEKLDSEIQANNYG